MPVAIETYNWLKAAHVVAAVMWVGGAVMLTLLGLMTIGLKDPIRLAQFARQAAFLGGTYFPPLSLIVLGVGFGLVEKGDWGYDPTWIQIGIVGWAVSFVVGAGYLWPAREEAGQAARRPAAGGRPGAGPDPAHPPRRPSRLLAPPLHRVRHDRQALVLTWVNPWLPHEPPPSRERVSDRFERSGESAVSPPRADGSRFRHASKGRDASGADIRGALGTTIRDLIRASLFGKPLPDGGTIGVASPATGVFRRSDVERGVAWWESHGYRVKLSEGVFTNDDWSAGDPERRARDLEELFADPDVDVVQCYRGGYGSAQLIPHLDFDLIAANPKPFVGFSDITALHESIRQRTGLATFYGPGLHSIGDRESTDFTRDQLLDRLRGAAGELPTAPDDPYVRVIGSGRATAPVVGGCLWLLAQTMGTPWEFGADDAILFFEDVNLPAWQLDGFLVQLRAAGKLDGVVGILVGEIAKSEFPDIRSGFPRIKSIEEVLENRLGALGVPVLYGLPLGHGKHLATLPLGVTSTLDADARSVTIDEPAVRA